ncbi:MAG TPA: CDGSH iron-sulfur domain-containing protein [Gammaproteobacteria bacterium]|nr:CDGSH iron-sulfur domain-containing protein [Gammaproteobacteria bacterium]
MSEPRVAQKSPYILQLEPGEYYWCSCGRSANQPFCDGSHQGSDFVPLKFTVQSQAPQALCGCKHSKNPPFCDGSHTDL